MRSTAGYLTIAVAGVLAATACSEAGAWERPYAGPGPYGAIGGGYGYAGEFVEGSYVGAPLTRFPRPNEIVPPVWGYGTYGVPTLTGIRQASSAPPTLIVIQPSRPVAGKRATRKPVGTRGGAWRDVDNSANGVGAPHVIAVTVPGR